MKEETRNNGSVIHSSSNEMDHQSKHQNDRMREEFVGESRGRCQQDRVILERPLVMENTPNLPRHGRVGSPDWEEGERRMRDPHVDICFHEELACMWLSLQKQIERQWERRYVMYHQKLVNSVDSEDKFIFFSLSTRRTDRTGRTAGVADPIARTDTTTRPTGHLYVHYIPV